MQSYKDLRATINGDRRFTTFAKIMESSNAIALLEDGGEFTVFAPTNHAFIKISRSTMNEWLNEPGQRSVRSLLHYHIVPDKILAGDIATASVRMSCSGEEIAFTDIQGLRVNRSKITSRNIIASNGVIHALDTVLLSPTEVQKAMSIEETPQAIPVLLPEFDPIKEPIRSSRRRTMRATSVF